MGDGPMPGSVGRMFLRQAAAPATLGLGAGVALSAAVIESTFPSVGGDGLTYLAVFPAAVAVVMVAAYIPARRAARLDPLTALRQE